MGIVRLWAVPETITVFPDASPEPENAVYSDASRTVRLDGAVNEAVAFQMVFRNDRSGSAIKSITIEDLVHDKRVIPADRVQLYREVRVHAADYPAWYLRLTPNLCEDRQFPDRLVPLSAPRGALPIELPQGESIAVWVEVRIPTGTEPAVYRSTMTIMFTTGVKRRLALVLNIWPFALPQTPHLGVIAGLQVNRLLRHHLEVGGRPYAPVQLRSDDPIYARAASILDGTLALLHDHRCTPMLTDLRPIRQVSSDGSLHLDWTDYDRLVSGVLDGTSFDDRVPVVAWPMPLDERNPDAALYGGWASPQYERMLVDYLRQCVEHFREKQWLDRHYVRLPLPGDTRAERYRQFEWLGEVLRRADTRLRTLCDLTPQSMTPWGWLGDTYRNVEQYVGIWAPPASLMDMQSLADQRKKGKLTWFIPDRPPHSGSLSLVAPPEHARSIAPHPA